MSELLSWGILIGIVVVGIIIWIGVKFIEDMVKTELLHTRLGFIPCDFEDVELLDEEFMNVMSEKIESQGFRWDDDYEIKQKRDWIDLEGKTESSKYAKRYFCEAYGTEALLYFYESRMNAENEEMRITTSQMNYGIELYTEFTDGKSIKTIAEQIPKVYREADTMYLYCWSENDIQEAVSKHLEEVQNKLKSTKLVNLIMSLDPEKDRERRLKATYEKGMKKGVYQYDSQKRCYRFTVKGAMKYMWQGIIMYFLDKRNTPRGRFKVSTETQREYFNEG